jgi:hypothetical protein
MTTQVATTHERTRGTTLTRVRRGAWLVVLIADVGLLLWGAGAALLPHTLPGPGSAPILQAGYEGYSDRSWTRLDPHTAGYVTLLFRMYGIYIVAFSMLAIAIAAYAFRGGERWAWWTLLVGNSLAWVAAMSYDRIVGAIGPFELSEYLGLALIYASLAATSRRDTGTSVSSVAVSSRETSSATGTLASRSARSER